MASPQAIFKFIKSLRPYIDKGLISIEDVYIHLNKKGVEVTDIVRKAVNNAFKKGPDKDPLFDQTKIDLPIDDLGKPFNPNKPLKEYGIPVTIEGKKTMTSAEDLMSKYFTPSGTMKKEGKDIVKKGLEGLSEREKKIDWYKKAADKKKYSDDFYKGSAGTFGWKGKAGKYPGVRKIFADDKEFAADLEMGIRNFIKNDPRFNLEIAERYKNPGVKTYSALPDEEPEKLLSPKQRQTVLDKIKSIMKHEEYQASYGEDFDFTEITDDMFRIEKAEGGATGLNYLMGL